MSQGIRERTHSTQYNISRQRHKSPCTAHLKPKTEDCTLIKLAKPSTIALRKFIFNHMRHKHHYFYHVRIFPLSPSLISSTNKQHHSCISSRLVVHDHTLVDDGYINIASIDKGTHSYAQGRTSASINDLLARSRNAGSLGRASIARGA